MRNKNYYINLNDREYLDVLSSLMNKRNKLIQSGKYTDGIDEVIMKIKTAKLYGSKPRLLTEVQSPARCRKLNTKQNGKITKWSCRFLFALMCRIFHIYVV